MSYFEPFERVGPFMVVLTNSDARSIKRRSIVVRCMACLRISVLAERTLAAKRVLDQHSCQKCRSYITSGTWRKGHKHGTRAKLP